MNTTRVSNSRNPIRRRRYLLAAGYSLTSILIAPTLQAEQSGAREDGFNSGVYPVPSALPFLRDRYVEVKPRKEEPVTPARSADPSQPPTALYGDPQ